MARTGHAVVALHHVVAFPQGCVLALHLAARRFGLDHETWKRVTEGQFEPERDEAGQRFGVRFPDGSRATTVGNPFAGWAPRTDRPEPPMLIEAGSESSSDDREFRSDQRLWLWPLPPGPFELVVEWRLLDMEMTSMAVEGGPIAAAARQALRLWT